ncbi:MAG: EF-hand domain-containing protein [Akkermansiaceae bacterium]
MKKRLSVVSLVLAGTFLVLAEDKSATDASLPVFLKRFDTNEDGRIDEEERQAIADLRAGLRAKQLESIDTDRDGRIQKKEIEAARLVLRTSIEERRLQKFREIAGEDDLISREEFATIPGSADLPDFVFDGIFYRLDSDRSGEVSLEEFFERLTNHQRPVRRSR